MAWVIVMPGIVALSRSWPSVAYGAAHYDPEIVVSRAADIKVLASERKEDAETLLGVAELYRWALYAPQSGEAVPLDPYGYRRVLAIDPQCKPAWAAMVPVDAKTFVDALRNSAATSQWLESKLGVVSGQGARVIGLDNSPRGQTLRGRSGPSESGNQEWMTSPNLAAAGDRVLEEIADAEAVDPENSLYDYCRAAIAFAHGQETNAIACVQRALAGSSRWDTHLSGRMKARQEVLGELKLGWSDRRQFLLPVMPAVSFVEDAVCGPLHRIGVALERKKPAEADGIYRLIQAVGLQIGGSSQWVTEVWISLRIQQRALEKQLRLARNSADQLRKAETERDLGKIARQRSELLELFNSAQDDHEDRRTDEEIQGFIESAVLKGDLAAQRQLENSAEQ